MKIIFVLLLATLFTKSSQHRCLPFYDDKASYTNVDLCRGPQGFALDVLQIINKIMPHENLYFSPKSIDYAFFTYHLISGCQKWVKVDKIRLDSSWVSYSAIKGQNAISIENEYYNINQIVVSDRSLLRECILTIFPFESDRFLDFAMVESSINKFADNYTNHMIQDVLKPGTIDSSTNLLLVVADWFKGTWQTKFDPKETKREIFYVNSSKQIMVDMMHVEGTFNHDISETLDAHVLELPHQQNASMYVLLPFSTKEDAVDNILKKLTLDHLKSFMSASNLTPKTVRVSLPKFSLEHTFDFQPILKSLGSKLLFKTDGDYAKLTTRAQLWLDTVSVDEAIYKAKIVITEKGVHEAATHQGSGVHEDDDFVQINCNRPFIFFIVDEFGDDDILFAGIYRKPDTLQ